MMDVLARLMVNRITGYVESNSLYVCYDTFDLEEIGVDDILRDMGIWLVLTADEKLLLQQELYKLFRQNEIGEVMRLVSRCQDE